MPAPILQINCNDRSQQILLRFLGLSFPYWGIATCFIATAFSSSTISKDIWQILLEETCLPLWVAGYFFTFKLLRNRISGGTDFIKLPGIFSRRIDLDKLVSVRCFDKEKDKICFVFKESEKTLRISRIEFSDRLKLLQFLDRYAKSCRVESDARECLESPEIHDFDPQVGLRIPFDGHFRLKSFLSVCLEQEKFLWGAWFLVCGPLAVFAFPLMLIVPFVRLTGKEIVAWNTPAGRFYDMWFKVWNDVFGGTVTKAGNSVSHWSEFLMQHPKVSVAFAILACLFFLRSLFSIFKPTEIVADQNNIWMRMHFSGILNSQKISWTQIKYAKVSSSEKNVSHSKLVFYTADEKKLLEIDLAGLAKNAYRLQLKRAIEHYAPHVEIDPLFVESVVPTNRQSYTELWLQSLNSPPKRDRLVPLKNSDLLQEGQYKVLETVGAGGQGIAYLAEDQHAPDKELIVIKEFMLPVFVERRARQQAIERFEQEAKALQSFDNANIVKLKGHFIEDHRAYLVLERIKGKSLRKLFYEKPISDEKLLAELVRQMCSILDYLHGLVPPMVHRDFTPDNLILDESGILKLIDFNVARQDDSKSKTSVVGKHAYMPPEQFAGKPIPQSDIYALGATIFYCLAGTDPEPFSQSSMPPNAVDRDAVWGDLISMCTALNAADRAQSGRAVLETLNGKQGDAVKIQVKTLVKEQANG